MSKQKSHHIVPNPDGDWDVKKAGAERASKHFGTKQEAVDKGLGTTQYQSTICYPVCKLVL